MMKYLSDISLAIIGCLLVIVCILTLSTAPTPTLTPNPSIKVWYHVSVVEKGSVIFERIVPEVAIRSPNFRIDLKDGASFENVYIISHDVAVHYKEPVFPLFPSKKDDWEVCGFGNMTVELKLEKTYIRDWAEKK